MADTDGEWPAEKRCRTCRWWEQGLCALAEYSFPKGRIHPKSLARAMDAEGYQADLATAPEFGCVQWEPVTPPTRP